MPAANAFDGLQLGQFNPRRLKSRCPNEARENLKPPLQVLAEYIERRGTGLPPNRDTDSPGELFEILIHLFSRETAASA